jgi:hypothetical protein
MMLAPWSATTIGLPLPKYTVVQGKLQRYELNVPGKSNFFCLLDKAGQTKKLTKKFGDP